MHEAPAVNRAWIIGLVVECPLGTPVADCPVAPLRQIPLAESHRLVGKLSDSEVERLLIEHQQCLANRQQSGVAL